MGDGNTQEAGGDVDDVFRALATRRRRFLLAYLREHDSATRRELADVLTGWLGMIEGDGEADGTDWKHTMVHLQHVTIPNLRSAGLIKYDPETGVVELASNPEWTKRCVDAACEAERAVRDEEEMNVPGEPQSDVR